MNTLDLLIVVALVAGAVGGYRLGLLTRATSWIGMGLGLFAAARLLPRIVDRSATPSADRPGLAMIGLVVLVGGAFVGQAIGLVIGSRLSLAVSSRRGRTVDAAGGAVAGVLGVVVAVWLLVPTMADVQGWPAREARTSAVARTVLDWFPRPPETTETLRRLFGGRYPRVFDSLRPSPRVGPPPAASGFDDAAARRVAASTVKVVGEACGRIQEGSGFVVRPGLVATNAHVVAGEGSTEVERDDGSRQDATVVAFDPERDIAVLSVPGIARPPLPVGDPAPGQRGAVFGHPGGGPLELSPFQIAQRVTADGADIYGRPGTARDVLVLASALAPGDSGSALVTPQGTVVGVAFAIAPDRPGVAYALSTSELRAGLSEVAPRPVGTGPCVG
ncbi:MAG: MarP family serine protease [Actinobacteria bacterium]|nr:MarP family serine protease [Actinomycetota bacterium]